MSFLKALHIFFQFFYNEFKKTHNKHCQNVSAYSMLYPKRLLFFTTGGQKVVYVKVEFANYHNVQMDLEFCSFSHCVVSRAATASTGIWAPARPICCSSSFGWHRFISFHSLIWQHFPFSHYHSWDAELCYSFCLPVCCFLLFHFVKMKKPTMVILSFENAVLVLWDLGHVLLKGSLFLTLTSHMNCFKK